MASHQRTWPGISGTPTHTVEETCKVWGEGLEREGKKEWSEGRGVKIAKARRQRWEGNDNLDSVKVTATPRKWLWPNNDSEQRILRKRRRFWGNDGDSGKTTAISGKRRWFQENDDSGKTTAILGIRMGENDGFKILQTLKQDNSYDYATWGIHAEKKKKTEKKIQTGL